MSRAVYQSKNNEVADWDVIPVGGVDHVIYPSGKIPLRRVERLEELEAKLNADDIGSAEILELVKIMFVEPIPSNDEILDTPLDDIKGWLGFFSERGTLRSEAEANPSTQPSE